MLENTVLVATRASRLTTSKAPSSQLLSPSLKKLPTTMMLSTSRAIMKISKLRSIGLPMAQPTSTTSGALKSAVWIEGPRQWYSATLITPSHASSMAVRCSAAFSTSGSRIRPRNWSGTPDSTTSSICSTRMMSSQVAKIREISSATNLLWLVSFVAYGRVRRKNWTYVSVPVNLILASSSSRSASRCSSISMTSSKMLC